MQSEVENRGTYLERLEYLERRERWLGEIARRDTLHLGVTGKEQSGLAYEVHTADYFENTQGDHCAWLPLPDSIIVLEIGMSLAKYYAEERESPGIILLAKRSGVEPVVPQ